MIVFLDIDEVLADFIGAACRMHGVPRDLVELHRTDWDIQKPMGMARANKRGMSPREFWYPIERAGEKFWSELEAFSWMDDLVSLIKRESTEWYLVTSPSQSLHAYGGKITWIRKYFGDRFNRVFLCHHKDLLAGPDRLLIDDRLENTTKFRNAGGNALLFPTAVEYRGSRYVTDSGVPADPVGFVENCLRSLNRKKT